MTKNSAQIGSVSSATIRPEDLIPTFLDELADLAGTADTIRSPETEKIATFIREVEDRMEAEDYFDSEEAGYDLEQLFEELDAFAPPYCYFGANEGNGSDYGFWVSWDSLEEDCRYGEVLKVNSGDEWPEDLDTDYVLEVTDHGNGTLYTRDHVEVWSVV